MKLSKRQLEIANDNRAAAGLPVLTCPNCGVTGARHWVPDDLDDNGLIIHGFYVCEARS